MFKFDNPQLVTRARPRSGFWYNGYHVKYQWTNRCEAMILTVKGFKPVVLPENHPVIMEFRRQCKLWSAEEGKKYDARMKQLAENKKNSPWTAFQWRLKFLKEYNWYTKRVRSGSAFEFYEVTQIEPDAIVMSSEIIRESKIRHSCAPIGRYEAKRTYSPESFELALEKIKADMLKVSKKEHDEVLKAIDAL